MRLIKKTVAFILIAFLSFVPIAGVAVTVPITVYAASPALSSTSLTVKVGQTKTLKIKNASAKKWGQTADIVKLAKKGSSINTITVKGLKKGTCKVACMISSGKILYCKVKVTAASSSGSSGSSSSSKDTNADKKIYNKIIAMKAKYPEGSRYDESNTYKGYSACQAFAYLMSDTAFGKDKPYYRHYDFGALRTGDIIYQVPGSKLSDGSYTTTTHALVVLKADYRKDELVLCEGNYMGKAHWGSTYSISEFALGAGASVTSRYSYSANHSVKATKPSGKMTVKYGYNSSDNVGRFTAKKLSKNCVGYQYLISDDKGFPYNRTQTFYTKDNYMQFRGTESIWASNAQNHVAYLKVRAINTKGGYVSYGKWSSVRTIR